MGKISKQACDLISREALREDFDRVGFNDYDDYNRALRIIDNAPAVEYTFEEAFQKTVCDQRLYCPERPQGEWIGDTDYESYQGNYEAYKCSICGYGLHWRDYSNEYKFCPNCGAKMKGDVEKDER